jgi:hypothetical protein
MKENEKENGEKKRKRNKKSYFLFSLSSSVSSERRINCEKCRKQTIKLYPSLNFQLKRLWKNSSKTITRIQQCQKEN